MMSGLMVGVARRNITPPVGASMAGYAGRDHGAEGVHDELWVRALFLCDGENCAALLCRDLLYASNDEMDLLAEVFEARLDLTREQLFIANTHTHSGPATGYAEDADNRSYVETLADICAGAVEEARSKARPATLGVAQRPVQCGVNRRELREGKIVLGVNPEGPSDTVVDVLRFADATDGAHLATIFRHGVHGVVMGSRNYLISGDAPGAAESFVEANLPGVAGFLAGASGNINAYHHGGTFNEVALLGRRLGAATVQATTEVGEARSDVRLTTLRHEFELPLAELEDEARLRTERDELKDALDRIDDGEDVEGLDRWQAERRLRHVEAQLEAIEAGEDVSGLPTFAQVLAIGDVALVGWPAEVFYEIAQQVREQSPFATTLDVTHVSGSIGYVPVASVYEEGGYEIRARAHHRGLGITPEAEEVMVRETLAALARAREAAG
ncbi:MAG: neutral/alkaline non-lysosomal ceramidase N-terminal domain-containing protein [Armatimonadota bacterium]|jgi:neutral ceramidase